MKIFASIAINSLTDSKIRKIILAGADVLRFNFAYSTIEENIDRIKKAQEVIEDLNYNAKIMIDVPGNKVRLGDFDTKIFAVKEGGSQVFKSGPYTPDCNEFIPVQIKKLGDEVRLNQVIVLGDGEIAIQIVQITDSDTVTAQILNNGVIQAMKGFNLNCKMPSDILLKTSFDLIDCLSEVQPDYIAVPFVDDQFNQAIDNRMIEKRLKSKLIIKIEDQNGVDKIEQIASNPAYDMVLIDRGELGLNISYEGLGLIQKFLIRKVKKYHKKVIVSTQIMESTINNYIPFRSEISDVTNIILDGADALMFCRETGFGSRPSYTISTARKIIEFVEAKIAKYGTGEFSTTK